MSTVLETHDLVVAYGRVVALREVSVEVGESELVVVLGANGAGKSTLVAAVVGWVRPRQGSVRFRGQDVTRLKPWRRVARGLAVAPEGGRPFGELSVAENLELTRPSPRGLDRAYDLFPVLRERSRQAASTLSGGERQMLALARAIATEPRLLVVDEASSGLMPVLVDSVFTVLRELRDDGLPILLVEQNTKALDIADRAYVFEAGRVVREGPPHELEGDPGLRRAYLGG